MPKAVTQTLDHEEILAQAGLLGDPEAIRLAAQKEIARRKALETPYEYAGPKQEEFDNCEARTAFLFGANRTSKSETMGKTAVDWVLGRHPILSKMFPPPVHLRYVGVDFQRGVKQMILPKIYKYLPESEIAKLPNEDTWQLDLKNKSFIQLMSNEQQINKFWGISVHGVFYDEEPRWDIWMENQIRVSEYDGIIRGAMTPEMGLTYIYDEVYLKAREDPDIKYWVLELDDNKFLSDSAKAQMRKQFKGHDMEDAKLRGKFVPLTGLVFKELCELHIVEPRILPTAWLKSGAFAIDPHMSKATACLWVAPRPEKMPNGLYQLNYYDELSMEGMGFQGMSDGIRRQETVNDRRQRPRYRLHDPIQAHQPVDVGGGRTYLQEFARQGINCLAPDAYKRVIHGLMKMKDYLRIDPDTGEPGMVVQEHLERFRWEMEHLAWKQQKLVGGIRQAVDELPDKHNDFISCARWLSLSEPKYREPEVVMSGQIRKPKYGRIIY